MRRPLRIVLAVLLLAMGMQTVSADEPFYAGADISMLPEFEASGAVYRDAGRPDDAITIMRRHGVNLFRLRLFVDPDPDFTKHWGATQDLATVRALAKRVKASRAAFLLDFHYSDTWADPAHQTKPAAWTDLHGEALEQKVYDYTAEVLATLAADGTLPDMVQVGNEITPGLLWPDGQLLFAADQPEQVDESWAAIARLVKAGVRAVRDAETPEHPIRIMIHIDGGDHEDRVKWWFDRFVQHDVDFDLIGLSFYPTMAGEDGFAHLKENLRVAAERFGKDVMLVETAFPHRPGPNDDDWDEAWPATPEGQAAFLRDVVAAVRAVPDGRGRGVVYWYPESYPARAHGVGVWMGGRFALFDAEGNALPGLDALTPQP